MDSNEENRFVCVCMCVSHAHVTALQCEIQFIWVYFGMYHCNYHSVWPGVTRSLHFPANSVKQLPNKAYKFFPFQYSTNSVGKYW